MSFHYSGDELPLMAQAVHWKSYIAKLVRPYMGSSVLEVGAGIGNNIPFMFRSPVSQWTALEPDATQAAQITGAGVRVVVGTLAAIDATERFDAILYFDVLEHIEDDARELRHAAARLTPGGRLVILSPAHPFLFSPMDTAVGHFRRYTSARLRELTPEGCLLERLILVDSVGFFASLANRLLLRTPALSAGQLRLWDGFLVPVSLVLDRLLFYHFGRSILAVWRRNDLAGN
jgi:SAM-dependent methyltransferase